VGNINVGEKMIALLADRRIQIVILVVAALLVANYSGLLSINPNIETINSISELSDLEIIALDSILVAGTEGDRFSSGGYARAIAYGDDYIWTILTNRKDIRNYDSEWKIIDERTVDYILTDITYSNNNYIWGVRFNRGDSTDEMVYKFNVDGTYTGFSFKPTLKGPYGITSDGNYIWVSIYDSKCIQKYTQIGQLVDTIDLYKYDVNPTFICSHGSYIWFGQGDSSNNVYKVGKDGTYIDEVFRASSPVYGLATNGINIWVSTSNTKVYKYDIEGISTGIGEWVLPDIPIDYGFKEYIGLSNRKQIQTTFTPIEADIPKITPMMMDFSVPVSVGDYTDSEITLKFYNKLGGVIGTSYTGNPPNIQVNGLDGTLVDTLVVSAERDGVTQSRIFDMEFDDLSLIVGQPGYYEYGHTVHLDISFSPDVGNEIATVQLKNADGNVLEEYAGLMPTIELTRPKAIGNTEIYITSIYRGIEATESFWVFFEGEPVITTVHTESYVQYDTSNIVFDITVQNVLGEYLSDTVLSNIVPICSLSDGNILESNWNYVGNGVYRVSSRVVGTGNFIGKLKFTYMNENFMSDPISINVNENKLSIGTGEIPPSGIRGVPLTVIVTVYDAEGQLTDPDTIYATAKKPDGWSTEQISYDEFTHVSIGRYSFGYTADQLEKFTFEITAEKSGLTKGFTSASILFASAEGEADITAPTDSMLSMLIEYWYIILILLIAAVILIWRFR